MTYEELEEALQDILGNGYQIDKDNHGQIIIYTGLCEDDDGDLIEFESDDDDDDFDPEFEPLDDEDDDE
jgi:hypothetical protein